MLGDYSFVPSIMDPFDENGTQGAAWQVQYDNIEPLEYENTLNDSTNPWCSESTEKYCGIDAGSDFSVVRDEYEFSSQAFGDASQKPGMSVFSCAPLLGGRLEEQPYPNKTLEGTFKSLQPDFYPESEKKRVFCYNEQYSSSLPENLHSWSLRARCSSDNSCDREIERGLKWTENSTCLGTLQERVRLLEEENYKLNVQVSRYKEENSMLREALDRFRSSRSLCGAETRTSVCYPESEEDSSSKVQERRKRRRRRGEDISSPKRQESESRRSEESEKEEREQCNEEENYFYHKLDSLYLKSNRQNNVTTNPAEFVSLVKDMTEPLTKTDPARAATLTMFIFALALGLFSFQCRSSLGTQAHQTQYMERVLWNSLQDCMKDCCFKGNLVAEMRNGFVGISTPNSPHLEDVDRIMKSYLDTSGGQVLKETSPEVNTEFLHAFDDPSFGDDSIEVTGNYVSSWEQLVGLDKFGGEEFGGD